jgi:hypothetical protein
MEIVDLPSLRCRPVKRRLIPALWPFNFWIGVKPRPIHVLIDPFLMEAKIILNRTFLALQPIGDGDKYYSKASEL